MLAEARKRVGALALRVEPAGAEVLIDGASIGKAPLTGEVFVDPGPRTIEARIEGYKGAKVTVETAAGSSREVPLTLAKIEAKNADAGVGEGRKDGGTAQPARRGAGQNVVSGPGTPGVEGGPSKALIIAGATTSAAVVGAGVVFAVVSSVNASDAHDLRESLIAKGDPTLCLGPMPAQQCTDADRHLAARDTFRDFAIWSFVTGGVVGAGVAVYAYVAPRSKAPSEVRVLAAPMARGGGVVVAGEW